MTDFIIVAGLVAVSAAYIIYQMVRPFGKKNADSCCTSDKCANCSLKISDGQMCREISKKKE